VSEAIGQPGEAALPGPMGIGEILSTAFQLYRRYWRTLLAIAAVVVVPFTLLQYLLGHTIRVTGVATSNGVAVTSSWRVGLAGLVTALAGVVMFLVLTGAITRAVAAEAAGEDPGVEQSYRFGFHRLGSVLLVSVLVGLATIGGLILFIIPGIWIGVRLSMSTQALVVEGRRPTEAMGRSWALVGGHWWHAFGTLVVAGLLTGLVNALITTPFNQTSWFLQAVVAAIATVITLPYGDTGRGPAVPGPPGPQGAADPGAAPSRPPGISHLTEWEAGRTEDRSRCHGTAVWASLRPLDRSCPPVPWWCLGRLVGPLGRLYRSAADW
jgi:hypothetical protein